MPDQRRLIPVMWQRHQRRRWMMGLSTILGLKTRGFFLPYRYADTVQPLPYPGLEGLFRDAEPVFEDALGEIRALAEDVRALPSGPCGTRFDQAWFPGLDALAAYMLVRHHRPRRIVEVGSGHSTRFMAAGIRDGKLEASLTCIDPAPRATLEHLLEHHSVTWRSSVLQMAPTADIDALSAGDMLFIDSSHLLMPGTDVDYLIGHLLARLQPGVFLHIHDIFLPDPYPASWAWRGYNEQSAVAALLQGEGYELVFASHYIRTRLAPMLTGSPFDEARVKEADHQGSLWLCKRGRASVTP